MDERISWDAEDIDRLAVAFVKRRIANPFAPTGNIFDEAQRDVLDEKKWRTLGSVNQAPKLVERIKFHWQKAMRSEPMPSQIIQDEIYILEHLSQNLIQKMRATAEILPSDQTKNER